MFGTLNKIWRSNKITTATKVKLYGTFVIPVIMYGYECWCLRKEDERRILVAEMNTGKNTGKVQKRKDTKRGYQNEAGTTGHIGRQNQKKKADVVWARNKDGGKQTTGSSAIRTSGGNKKQRKTTKEVDR